MQLTVNLSNGVNRAPATTGILLITMIAVADPTSIEDCRKQPTDKARIACLEAALSDGNAGEPGPEETRSVNETPPVPADARNVDAEASEAARDRDVSLKPSARRNADPGAAGNPTTADDDIGARQVQARNRSDAERKTNLESVTGVQVAAYSEVPWRRLQVTLKNGQVWRQIAGDTQHVRANLERNQTVDISESGIGGYRLRLNEMERTIRVERIR